VCACLLQTLDPEQEGAIRAVVRCLRLLLAKMRQDAVSNGGGGCESRHIDTIVAFKPLYELLRDCPARCDVGVLLEVCCGRTNTTEP
jgi:hypothetical protein